MAENAIIDFAVNYCNLRNLIVGSQLHQDLLFIENSNDTVCTMYGWASCDLPGEDTDGK